MFSFALSVIGGCEEPESQAEGVQGVVELDLRQLAFEVGGRVDSLAVDPGDEVHRDAEVGTLDPTLASVAIEGHQAELRAAEARLSLLQAGPRREEVRAAVAELRGLRSTVSALDSELTRQRTLVASGASAAAMTDRLEAEHARARAAVDGTLQRIRALRSGARPEELEVAAAVVAATRHALDGAEAQLAKHHLSAPFDGTVLEVHIRPGEVVGPGTPVVAVADLSRPYVDVFVPQGRLAEVRVDQDVRVRVDAHAHAFEGRVEHVGRQLEFTPRFLFSETERPNLVARVRVRINDPEHRLAAGVPAFVTLEP